MTRKLGEGGPGLRGRAASRFRSCETRRCLVRPAGARDLPPGAPSEAAHMRLFRCQHCDQILYFENTKCERCGHRLGFMPEVTCLSALEPAEDNAWIPLAAPKQRRLFCTNAQYDACNWLVPEGTTDAYCASCRHNRTVPDLSVPAN